MNNRNLPCWCGSEKKYKKCHLQADEVLDTATQINRRMDNLKKKPNNGKLLALESIIQQSMYYNYTER